MSRTKIVGFSIEDKAVGHNNKLCLPLAGTCVVYLCQLSQQNNLVHFNSYLIYFWTYIDQQFYQPSTTEHMYKEKN